MQRGPRSEEAAREGVYEATLDRDKLYISSLVLSPLPGRVSSRTNLYS